MKLCKDCKYCDDSRGLIFAKCIHPNNLVSGGKIIIPLREYCETRRIYDCGMHAKFFEPKTNQSEDKKP